MDNKSIGIFGFFGIIFVILIFSLAALYQYSYGFFWKEPSTQQDILDRCNGLELEKTARCLIGKVGTFYEYTSGEKNSITIDDFKENGGNCVAYSNLLANLSIDLGFNSKTIIKDGIKDVLYGHQIAIIWDDERYCELDQVYYTCHDRDDTNGDGTLDG